MSDHMFENMRGELFGSPEQATPGYPSRGSRAEFKKHIKEVPGHVYGGLQAGTLRLGDHIIYSIKPVGASKTIKLFETQDDKEVGLRNISNAKLPKGSVMMVSGVYLMAGTAPAAVAGSPTADEIKATQFASIGGANLGALANAEFDLKANKKVIVPEVSCRVFVTDNNNNWPLGFYKLHNPRLIQDDVLLEATIELGTTEDIPQDTYLYLGLYGTISTP